ncbi:TonB-dependent receptor [Pseudopedobacter beijingensis]
MRGENGYANLKKWIMRINLTTFVLILALVQASAKGFSQINLNEKKTSLQSVFKNIESQTSFVFFLSDFDPSKVKIDVNLKNANIEQAMDACLKELPLAYQIVDNTVVVSTRQNLRTVSGTDFQNQTIEIKGKIIDAKGEPLPGAGVKIKGTNQGTVADMNGNFILKAVEKNAILIVSYTGFNTQEVPVNSRGQLSIVLKENLQALEELVVVGYSSKKQSELTSAVTVVSADKLKDVTANNVGTMLQGKVAGLQVVNSSGSPGSAPEIRLRGVSSVNASQQPLTVVDGIIGGNYDPNDVESITVLKDAGSTALYGSQANAGVIIITTKSAAEGKTQFEAKISSGFRTADFGKLEVMNSNELYDHQKEFYRDYIVGATDNSYKIDLIKFYAERPLSLRNQDYDWVGESFKAAPVNNFYLSARGKTEKNAYYAGVSYYNEKGTFLNTNFQRINVRANSNYTFTKKLNVTNNINLSASTGKSYDYMDMYYSFLNLPWDNPYDASGNPMYVDGNTPFKWWSRDKINPLHTIANSDHPYKGFDVNYDLGVNYKITNWLTFTSTNRISAGTNKSTNYFSPLVAGTYHDTGFLEEQNSLYYGGISNNLLKFNFKLNDHELSGLAGVAFEGGREEYSGASGRGLAEGLRVLNVVSSNRSVNGYFEKSYMQSFISQLNYNYLNKYFVSGSFRVDGSTAFPEDNQYASFPSISGAWLMSNEDFLKENKIIDNLKLRLSYGVTGTQDIGASRFMGLFSLKTQYNSLPGAIPYQLPNPLLTWESKHQLNAGIDIGLFKRVNLSVDLYRNNTKDLLLEVAQPLSTGFEKKWENAGNVINKGAEITLNTTNIQNKNFIWNTDFTINFNNNKLEGVPDDFVKTGSWSISQIYRNGGNLYEFYMPKWVGVDPQTGAPLWEKLISDENGKVVASEKTDNYSDATMQEVGSALPKYQGGFNNSFKYKDFGLRVSTYFSYGNKVFSNNLRFMMNDGHEPYYNQLKMPKDSKVWSQPGDIATEPSPQNSANSTETSTRYLRDGGYFTIRNIALTYALPKSFVNKMKFDGITLGLTADNVYTFTNFLGQDPQTTITPQSYATPGVSDFKYPNNRQYLFTIDFRF